ncbi:MAG: hypothetical protein HYU52_13535 [Acidobacteria bacterium]|nr:hypothetical protein [Acidobacteriota bacterium]
MSERWNGEPWRSRAKVLSVLAGATDTTTGILLVAAPHFTLHLMGIETEDGNETLIRFIGAFVLGVGASYFLPFLQRDRDQRIAALRSQFATTGLIRLSIALFTGAAVASGALIAPWLSVTASDLALAAVQGLFIRSRVLDAEN